METGWRGMEGVRVMAAGRVGGQNPTDPFQARAGKEGSNVLYQIADPPRKAILNQPTLRRLAPEHLRDQRALLLDIKFTAGI